MTEAMHWLQILSFCILFFWNCNPCYCFSGCNYCSDLGNANLSVVLTSFADAACGGTTCNDELNLTWTMTAASSADCSLITNKIGDCMCTQNSRSGFSCPLGGGIRDFRVNTGAMNASGGLADIRVQVCDAGTNSGGNIATFSYTFTAPINCDTTNGPFAMTLISSAVDLCDGTGSSATIQIGP
jgi:hypothetical protein